MIKKFKNTAPWTSVISDINGEGMEHFMKTNQKVFRVEKVIKRKVDKLYVK